jgi:hypothetical protein
MLQLSEQLKLMGLCCWLLVECRQIGARIYFSFDFVKSGTIHPPLPIVSMSLKWSTKICSKCSYILFISAICNKQVILDSPFTESPHFMQCRSFRSTKNRDWNAAAAENAGYIESLYDQTLLRCKSRLRHDTPILRQQCTGGWFS